MLYIYIDQVLLNWSGHYWQLLLKQNDPDHAQTGSKTLTPDPRRFASRYPHTPDPRRFASKYTLTASYKGVTPKRGGLFSPSTPWIHSTRIFSPSVSIVFDQAMKEEAMMSLASAALIQQDPHRALELYDKVDTAPACWNSCEV